MPLRVYGDAAVHVVDEDDAKTAPLSQRLVSLVVPLAILPVWSDPDTRSLIEWPGRLTEQVKQEDWVETRRCTARTIGKVVLGALFGIVVGALIWKH